MPNLISKLLYEELLDHASQNKLLSLFQTSALFLIGKMCAVLSTFYLSYLPNCKLSITRQEVPRYIFTAELTSSFSHWSCHSALYYKYLFVFNKYINHWWIEVKPSINTTWLRRRIKKAQGEKGVKTSSGSALTTFKKWMLKYKRVKKRGHLFN